MRKNIILCSDGTGNKDIKDRGTNVFRFFEAIDCRNSRAKQISFYDDGVGTSDFKPLMILGGAFGLGLSRNVRQLYTELVRCYNPGDRIYLFGFSRGAYTVRVLSGLIHAVGIFNRKHARGDAELNRTVRTAYRLYRRSYHAILSDLLYYTLGWIPRLVYRYIFGVRCQARDAEDFRKRFAHKPGKDALAGRVPIEFIGVWDTVSAVGLPFDELATALDILVYKFLFRDERLCSCIKKGSQAISIDDERRTFKPMLWDESGEQSKRVEQVWFAGVHANVGGGYPRQGMSLVAMKWMMQQATASGLRFSKADQDFYDCHGNVHDKLYDSRAGAAVYYRFKPRDIFSMCELKGVQPKIHDSVLERIVSMSDGYAPGNIPKNVRFMPSLMPAPQLRKAEKFIRDTLGKLGSPLDSVRHWILIRQWAHFVFLAFTFVALYFLYQADGTAAGAARELMEDIADPDLTAVLMEKLLLLVRQWPWVLLVIVSMFALGRFLRWRMHVHYSRFWYPLLQKLKITA